MCSSHKRTEWICSSAPSGSRGQPRRSAWPISSTTSNGYCVCVDGWPHSAPNAAADRKITSPMRRRSTKHHPNIAEIVQSAQHLELLEVSSLDRAPDFYSVARFRDRFYRPDVMVRVLDTLDINEALRLADIESGRGATPRTA